MKCKYLLFYIIFIAKTNYWNDILKTEKNVKNFKDQQILFIFCSRDRPKNFPSNLAFLFKMIFHQNSSRDFVEICNYKIPSKNAPAMRHYALIQIGNKFRSSSEI